MEKIFKIIFILAIIIIVFSGIYDIYSEFFMSKFYESNTNYTSIEDEQLKEKLQNIVIKYILSVRENMDNINTFMPYSIRSKDKTQAFFNNINDMYTIKCLKYYKINNSTYRVHYTLYENQQEDYYVIIKIYENKNYFKILYDKLYDLGRKE